MECNKDEAIRAKKIAEKKFATKDIMGAKKFAQKAQKMYPGLENVSDMLTIFDVYIAAENKVDGEADWYGILGVNPQADDKKIRTRFRKLAIFLYPNLDNLVGAEGALKLISDAWMVLSNKGKKQAYDQKLSAKDADGSQNFAGSASPKEATPEKNSTPAGSSSEPSSVKQNSDTFWTVCRVCKVHYKYLNKYLNLVLQCPNCNECFMAIETSPPEISSTSKLASGPDVWAAGLGNFGLFNNAAQAKTISGHAHGKRKSKREEAEEAPRRKLVILRELSKKARTDIRANI